MNRRLNAILICIALIFFSYTAYADTKSDLEAQNRQAQSEIEQIKEEIKQKEASKTPYLEKKKQIAYQKAVAEGRVGRPPKEKDYPARRDILNGVSRLFY